MSTSDITTKVYIVAGVPATFDKSGYETLFTATPTQIKGVTSFGEIGVTDAMIDVPDLETGFTLAVKGARAGTDTAIGLREIKADAGQELAKTASAAFTEYSLMILEPTASGEVEYISGLPHDWKRNSRETSNHAGFTFSFRSNYASIVVAAPS